jgi:hypothetical protein
LNERLGPLAQFVSLSQSGSDPNLLWGGTQGNGAPAASFAQSAEAWSNVHAGDIGFTAINPANENEWFLAVPPDAISGVNVFRCGNGLNCRTQDFSGDQVVGSSSLAGDSGAFYLPFLLDPANPGTMWLGTCRVWRGLSSGGGYSPLSPNFEFGGSGACTGSETNMVRALAVGGPTDPSGNSQIAYAGTDGGGASLGSSPPGGRLWATMNAAAGPSAWTDRTGDINPQGFPISSIVIDTADPSGQTAYATVMGFHTSHVWKTTNAGQAWTDFTGNLPDSPANALVLDSGSVPNNGIVFVGTDSGVFSSSTTAPNWFEVGPTSYQPGFLPNVAVTSLKLFKSGGKKRLRAATYGRGIWEWDLAATPDFQVSIANSPQTVFAGQLAVYAGTIFARNGYGSSINLSCIAGTTPAPLNCSSNATTVVPDARGAGFSLNASDLPGNYAFNVQATGTDVSSITHTFPLVLHVVDFTLGTPSPNSVTLSPGISSNPVSLLLSAAGPFSGVVGLTCGGLPSGVGCQFQPTFASPSPGSAAFVTLTLSASSAAPLGTSPITISASSAGASTKTQTLVVNVSTQPDYVLSIRNADLSTQVNATAVFDGKILSLNGYASQVALSCGSGAPTNCTVTPNSVTPDGSGIPFSVAVSSSSAQTYAFMLNAVGSDPVATAHSAPISFTALPSQTFDFSMSATPAAVTVNPGKSALFSVTLDPSTGKFPSDATVSCAGMPALTSCNFNPSQVSSGTGNSTVTVSMSTTAPTQAASMATGIPFAAMLFAQLAFGRRRRLARILVLLIVAFCAASCGGGLQGNGAGGSGSDSPGTKSGDYLITLTATCGTVTHTATVTLKVSP